MPQKTWLPAVKSLESTRRWHHFDASGQVLGRLATKIAVLLLGKHKREYTTFMDTGDFVVVTNAGKIRLTGKKAEQKYYFRHSGYAKGAKKVSYRQQMDKDPTKVIYLAVRRMLGVNRLRARRMRRLKIFSGAENPFLGATRVAGKAGQEDRQAPLAEVNAGAEQAKQVAEIWLKKKKLI